MEQFYSIDRKLVMEVSNFPMKSLSIKDNYVFSVTYTILHLVGEK